MPESPTEGATMSGERRLTGRPIQRRTERRPFADSEDDVAAMIAAAALAAAAQPADGETG